MNSRILAAAVLGALCMSAAAQPANADDLSEFREELRALKERVQRLEQENAALRAQSAKPAAPSPVATSIAPANGAPATSTEDWYRRVSLKGDVRYRHMQTEDSRAPLTTPAVAPHDEEHLLRARLIADARVAEHLGATIGITTGDNGNPRGGNTRLDGEFSRKALSFDLAFIDWAFVDGGRAIAGKMRMPFARPTQGLFWDSDITPEGLALTYVRGPWFATGYGFWVDENVARITTASVTDTTDTRMYGAQFGGRFNIGDSSLLVAAMYYDLAAAQDRRPFYNGSSNGNSFNNSLSIMGGLAYDYQVAELMAEYCAQLVRLPLTVWFDLAQNQDAEYDMAFAAGLTFGKAFERRSWEAGLQYQRIEKDALFGQHIDADFGAGMTDSEGWQLRAAYVPVKNTYLSAIYYDTRGNVDVGAQFDFDRLLVDFTVKF